MSRFRWQTRRLGSAELIDDQNRGVVIDARGGGQPIRLSSPHGEFEIDVPGDGELPPADEQFVCDSTLHILFPQNSEQFAIRMAIEPIDLHDADDAKLVAGDDMAAAGIVLECRLSVQTDLLDSQPMLDLCVGKDSVDGQEPWTTEQIVLSRYDRPHTTHDDPGKLRLFGDFLEKGVIRRAQPWLIFGAAVDRQIRDQIADRQSNRKLVLND